MPKCRQSRHLKNDSVTFLATRAFSTASNAATKSLSLISLPLIQMRSVKIPNVATDTVLF